MRKLAPCAFFFVLIGCVTDPVNTDAGPGQGMRGGPCAPMMQCFSGLTCLDGTCVQLPDSGSSPDSGAADAGGDGMLMDGNMLCNQPTPPITSQCAQVEVNCLSANGMIGCVQTPSQCLSNPGHVLGCLSSQTCNTYPCCLDPMVQMPTGTCPETYSTNVSMNLTGCANMPNGCPGRQICASNTDCAADIQHPKCHPAIWSGTSVKFGVCGP